MHNFDEIVDRRGTDCKKYSLYPDDVIPMWIADTDFKSPDPVVDALTARAANGVYGYPPVSERFKRAVQLWEEKRHQFRTSVNDIEFVPGVIGGIICAVRALSRPGDKVLLQTPCYPPFVNLVESNGRRLLRQALVEKDGRYEINFEDFEKKCQDPLTRLFIFCNPHNPTGRVFTKEEITRLGEIALANHVTVLCDEIHCDLILKGNHTCFGSISEHFVQNSVAFINPSKTFNLPGFRTAALICANSYLKSLIHSVIVSNKAIGENIFGTLALCTAYEACDYYADEVVTYLQGNLNLIHQYLPRLNGIHLVEPEGTYLFWLDCRALHLSQEKLMKFFIQDAKVGIQSGTDFGPEGLGFVRMNVGCPRTVIREALERIAGALPCLTGLK